MAGLGRRHKEQVHQLLKKRKNSVNVTSVWRQIYAHFEVGNLGTKLLQFTAADRKELQQLAEKEWGFDPLSKVPDGSRTEVSEHSSDDKLATVRPNDHYVLIKSAQGNIPFTLINKLPQGCSLRIRVDELNIDHIESLVIIENLDSFDLWHQYQMPDSLQNTLALYRGHGEGIPTGIKNLLARLLPKTAIIVFPDLDPAGLQIACTTPNVTHLLVPTLSPELERKNNQHDYYKQDRQISYLEKTDLKDWHPLWNDMKENKTSIKQQHMLAFNSPLVIKPKEHIKGQTIKALKNANSHDLS